MWWSFNFRLSNKTVEGYKKLKKDIRGLLCREKLENGKKSTVRDISWCRSVSISRSVSIRVQNRISVNKCLEGEQNTTPRIINTTPKYLSIPKFCSKKRFRRGVVTFDPSGQKKTVYATFRALESCTTSTNHFAMNASEYCAGRRAFCCKECKKTLKIGVGWHSPKFHFLNHFLVQMDSKNMNFDWHWSGNWHWSTPREINSNTTVP